jgi:hypothetical protein
MMQRVLTDAGVAKTLRAEGVARSRAFQWADSARGLLAAFDDRLRAVRAGGREAAEGVR